jgi:NTE family protein
MVRAAVISLCLALAPALAGGQDLACVRVTTPNTTLERIVAPGVRIGIALGSGSMHGLAHVGVLQELEAQGLDVRVVAGTSIGAMVGALWASGMSGADIERAAREWDTKPPSIAGQLGPLLGKRPIQDWPRRFGAVATNLDNGHRRILMSGDGVLALQASSAVPVLFSPVTIGGERLVDGALVEPVPVDTARALGADFVIAIDVGYRPYEESSDWMTRNAFQAMHILVNSLSARQRRDADVAIQLDVHRQLMACGPDALIAAGRDAVRAAWPEIARSVRARAIAPPAQAAAR